MKQPASQQPGRGLEGIIATLIGTQEIQRLHAVANHNLPKIDNVAEKWYWNHSGDFFQGYGIALCLDIAAEYLSGKIGGYCEKKYGPESRLSKAAEYIRTHHTTRSIGAAAISSCAVAAAEALSFLNYQELWDIPAGIAGALLYVGTRAYVTARHTRIHNEGDVSVS